MKSAPLRILITTLLFVTSVLSLPDPTYSWCEIRSRTIWGTYSPCVARPQCANPMEHLCCDTVAECNAQNPFCAGTGAIRTALGCIPTSDTQNTVWIIATWAVGLAGLATLLLIVYAGFTIATAEGDPKKINSAKDTLTSAVLGLILITSAIVVLNFLGFNVLGLSLFGFRL